MKSDAKPRVVLVGLFPPYKGGMTTFLLNLMDSHLSDEFDFIPFTTSRPMKPNVIDNAGYGAVFRGGIARLIVGIAVTLFHLAVFPWTVIRRRADLIQVQASDFQVFWESMVYVMIARALRKPVLLRVGGSFDRFYSVSRPFMQCLIAHSIKVPDVLIVQSRYWLAYMESLGRTHDVVVVNNFVMRTSGSAPSRPERDEPEFFFFAGQEARRKGVDVLLAALRDLRERGLRCRVTMVAVPPLLSARIKDAGLDEYVRETGYLEHEEVISVMGGCDGLLLPSLGEGFPNTLLEGMACGIPVIATTVGSIPEVLSDGECGILVPPGDHVALSSAIERLIREEELRRRMGQNGLQTVRRRFTQRPALEGLRHSYHHLLNGLAGV